MEEKISIQKENVLNAYKHASEEQKALLENMFGKDMFPPKNIIERVKTFEDACEVLGEDHQYVKAYREWMRISYADCKDITAYLKLRIICAALNEGWKPNFDGDECRVVSRSSNYAIANGGVVYSYAYGASSVSHTVICSRLVFKTRELSEYCEKQFIDIWEDYLFA